MFRTESIVCFLFVASSCWSAFRADRHGVFQAAQITAGPVGEIGPRCSPDGRYLAFEYFSLEHPTSAQVWLMPKNGQFSDAKPLLAAVEEIYGEPSWSPDSNWLSFIRGVPGQNGAVSDQVYKINVTNHEMLQLTTVPPETALGGTSWAPDGRILFEMNDDIYVVPETGGSVTKLIDVRSKLPGVELMFPSWSPDESRVAFVGRKRPSAQSSGGRGLYVADLRTGRITKILEGLGDDAPFWFDDESILCSRTEHGPRSSVWIAWVSGGRLERLTKGPFDVTPAVCADHRDIYFARNRSISRPKSLLQGFHIWRLKLEKRGVVPITN